MNNPKEITSSYVTVNLYALQLHSKCFHNMTEKHSTDSHFICQAAVSQPLHLAKTKESQTRKACKSTQKEAEEWAGSKSQNVLLTGPNIQSRNAFK